MLITSCGTTEIFGEYEVAEQPGTEAAPYPRLVDTPEAPPEGVYTNAVPDPAQGVAVEADLTAVARAAKARAERLSAPVLTAADYRRLGVTPPPRS